MINPYEDLGRYYCEVHGEIFDNIVGFQVDEGEPETYCVLCFRDMVARNCSVAHKVADDADTRH